MNIRAEERKQFEEQVSRLYGGNHLAAVISQLRIHSDLLPRQGSFSNLLAIYAEEVEKAAAEHARLTSELARIGQIAIRERTWRLEDSECGGDEVQESIEKLKAEIATVLTSENATAYARGMSRAAEIAEDVLIDTRWGCDGDCGTVKTVPAAILAAIPSTDREKGGERCEWKERMTSNWADAGCGPSGPFDLGFQFCPYCGKPISIKED